MSTYSIERTLWEISGNGDSIGQFLSDPEQAISAYQLSDAERKLICTKDVRRLADMQVSPMLLMLFWMAVSGGNDSLPEYLQKMNTPA